MTFATTTILLLRNEG
ncbi:Protein of unknown function [Streptococcus thermophilus]|nr:Protein of unknown function [Streptococcus thermophilus]